MKHLASPEFWELFNKLPGEIQRLARIKFELLKGNPRHPSLHLKRINRYWSVRVSIGYRTLGIEVEDAILWSWIGPHAQYEKAIRP